MTELERRALLGDKQAQKECTEKGIILPCPHCGVKLEVKENIKYAFHPHSDCIYEGIELSTEVGLAKWNTRVAPPIGRCEEC